MMSQDQESPQCTDDQHLQKHGEAQGSQDAQGSKAVEETSHYSSHTLMPANLSEAASAEAPSAPEGPRGFFTSSIAIIATLWRRCDVGFSSEEEESSSTSEDESDDENVPADALDQKVALLVNFMLIKYRMKEPIRKADMLKIVVQEEFPEILLRASERIEMVFGLDVKEIDHSSQRYGLFIKLGLTYDGMESGEDSMPKTGILILILGVIFMKGNRATEEEVWEVLNMTGIYSGEEHFIFGDLRKLITHDLVKENYLEYQQVANSDPPRYEFLWGPRAYAETTKMKILEFVAKVHGTDPSSFPSQYEEAMRDEEERVSAGPTSVATAGCSAESSSFASSK